MNRIKAVTKGHLQHSPVTEYKNRESLNHKCSDGKPALQQYGPLAPTKWIYHSDRVKQILNGDFNSIHPITVHLAPTLRCDHSCYFCTYGGAKGNTLSNGDTRAVGDHLKLRIRQKDMPIELMNRVISQIAEIGVRGVIFTGGGEPTLYPQLAEAMRFCRDQGIDFSMNTNGRGLQDRLLDEIVPLNPRYVRISLNSGSSYTQRLITGVDDFTSIMANIERLIRKKYHYGTSTDISVGYVINVVNYDEIMNIVRHLHELEERIENELGITESIFSIQFRPVGNYESSKNYNSKRIEEIIQHLRKVGGEERAQSFKRFMFEGEQSSADVLDTALETLDNKANEYLTKHGSRIRLVYPRRKFHDLPRIFRKSYGKCRILPWFLFIWPDGTVYPCVEWAGTPGFEVGYLAEELLSDILRSDQYKQMISRINCQILHSRCAPICAHHEMNILLDEVASAVECGEVSQVQRAIEDHRRNFDPPCHINFL